MIVAVVMVLQRLEGCRTGRRSTGSRFDARWKYAAGGLDFDYPGFVHTVLVDMRARLARSERPDRIFEVTLEAAKAGRAGRPPAGAGLDPAVRRGGHDGHGHADPLGDPRAARVADGELAAELRAVLRRDDDYASAGKPVCDYDDPAAREALVDALARDAHGAAGGPRRPRPGPGASSRPPRCWPPWSGRTSTANRTGVFRIARRVATDRVISTVDPQARHGHKTTARGFDGYKGHVAIDPDSEIITATAVTAGNAGDAAARRPDHRDC